jgi:hypothetical protein
LFAAISPAAAEPKRVLLLHSFGPQFAPWVFYAAQFRQELFKLSPDKIALYEASLEGAQFEQSNEDELLMVGRLTTLFEPRKLDLVVAIGSPATFFVQKYRSQLFPSTPLVLGGQDRRAINDRMLTSNDAAVPVVLNFKDWIESILQVRPDTTHIAWVIGASPMERFWSKELDRESQPFMDRISFERLNDLRFEGSRHQQKQRRRLRRTAAAGPC